MFITHALVGSPTKRLLSSPKSTRRAAIAFGRVLAMVCLSVAVSGCFSRPGFLVRVYPAVVPYADASRSELTSRVTDIERQLASGSVKGGKARELREELLQLQTRLEKGDFQIGDQLIVTVTQVAPQIDTATVRDGLTISLTALPDVSLAGLLRSELQGKVQEHVNRFLVDHRVRTNLLTRIQVLGAVGQPGFYAISPDRTVAEVITLAGGPAQLANLDKVTVRRDARLIVKPGMWKDAVRAGTTVAQLGLQSGDVLEIEMKKQRDIFQIVQVLAFGATALFAVIQLLQFIYREPE